MSVDRIRTEWHEAETRERMFNPLVSYRVTQMMDGYSELLNPNLTTEQIVRLLSHISSLQMGVRFGLSFDALTKHRRTISHLSTEIADRCDELAETWKPEQPELHKLVSNIRERARAILNARHNYLQSVRREKKRVQTMQGDGLHIAAQ